MRVAVNLRRFRAGAIGGQESYARRMLEALREEELTVFAQPAEFANLKAVVPEARFAEAGNCGEAVRLGLRRAKFDVLFCPLHALEPLEPGLPSAVMTPDLQHERYPGFFDAAELLWRRQHYAPGSRQAHAILTPSEAARREIIERYGVEERRVHVTPLDVEDVFRAPADEGVREAVRRLRLPDQYVYFPANFWPHKNHAGLLEALRLLKRSDLHLVLTGQPAEGARGVLRMAERMGLTGRVRYAGYQPAAVAAEIMRGARVVAFATLHEGFGLPVLEAMHAGVPVVASRGGACEEVAGGAAVLVEPEDPASIARGIESAARDEALRARLIELGRERRKQFDWARTARKTREVLASIAGGGAPPAGRAPGLRPSCRVIICSAGDEAALRATAASVEAQSRPAEFSVVSQLEPGGAPRAFNKAMRRTGEDVVCLLEEGDVLTKGAVEAALDAFALHPDLAFVYGDRSLPFERASFLGGDPVQNPVVFYSRSAFEEAGGIRPAMTVAWSFDLRLRMSGVRPALHIAQALAHPAPRLRGDPMRRHAEIIRAVGEEFGQIPLPYLLRAGADLFGKRAAPCVALLAGAALNARRLPWFLAEWLRSVRRGWGWWQPAAWGLLETYPVPEVLEG